MAMTRNVISASELFNLMNENGLVKDLNRLYFEGEMANSAKAQEELEAWINKNNITLGGQKLTKDNIEIHEGGNNFNIMIKAGNVGLVMQFGMRPQAVDEAMQFLTSTTRPKWLAEQYDQHIYDGQSQFLILNSPREKDQHPDNHFSTANLGVLTVQEFCPSTLKSRVAELHKPADTIDHAAILKLASDVGKGVASMMSDLSGSEVLWTDIKPGNILFHKDGSIAIADTKAFTPIEKMPYRRIKGDKNIFNYSGLVTEGFLSDHMRRNVLGGELKRANLQSVWEKEYSYQLGVLLHYIATGNEYVSPRFNLDPYQALDFNKPIFATEEGARLQYVIEKLIDHNPTQNLTDDKYYFQTNPDNRIHVGQAMELLALISSKEQFEAKAKEISENNKQLIANTALRSQGKQDEIKFPKELIDLRKSIADIKPNYEKRMLGLKHKLSKKNSASKQEKYAVMDAINQKAEQLLAQYPQKSVAQIQSEMQQYLNREMTVLKNQDHLKSALHKYISKASQEIAKQQVTPTVKVVKPREKIPLKIEEYVKLYFANTSATVRNRPFDTAHYKDFDSKKAGEYGANATLWKITSIKADEISLTKITELRNAMLQVAKDLAPHLPKQLNESERKALQSLQAGYIFNAFNQKMLAELKTNVTDERKVELKQLAELVRFVADDLVAGKTPQESLDRLEQRNIAKVQACAHRGICNEISRDGVQKGLKQEDKTALKIAGIHQEQFVNHIRAYATIGENKLNELVNPKQTVNSFHREQVQALREVLVDAFARTALAMDVDISNKSKYPMVGLMAGMKEMSINNHPLKKDFDDLLRVTEGVLSITKYFANNAGVRLLNSQEKQNQIVKINNKLASLIAHYPYHPDTGLNVTANDIRQEMRNELLKVAGTPELKGLMEKQINRVIGRQSTILDNANKPPEPQQVEQKKPNAKNDPVMPSINRRFM